MRTLLPAEKRRSIITSITLSPDERKIIDAALAACDCRSIGEFIRSASLVKAKKVLKDKAQVQATA